MSLRWRVGCVAALVGLLSYLALANFAGAERREAAWWLPDDGLRLGLDLQGGIHMVVSPDLEVALAQELAHLRNALEEDFEEKDAVATRIAVEGAGLRIDAAEGDDAEKIGEVLAGYDVLQVREGEYGSFRAELIPEQQDQVRERAVLQTLEVLRRRIDDPQTGIPESVLTRQGRDRILIQIPGVSRVPDIFAQTGFLEFKIVQDTAPSEELLRARYEDGLPEGSALAVQRDPETERVIGVFLVPDTPDITGDYLADARVQFDSRRSEWQVAFTWNAEGARIFGTLTEANIGNPLGIIVDGEVYSTPVIRDRISRQGVITGDFSSEQAGDLAVNLRSGALPIPVVMEEERTIGPALGSDSIQRGVRASLLGLILVVAFMAGYYRLSGGYASVALMANLLMVVGLMSLFEGTLTLPGIAGLVLTVGMAVDANVIIFERIREEVRSGKTVRAAVGAGFQKATWTILDANITTLITAIILFEFGTGPIKGFAVTLSVGILTSVFCALVITRLLFQIHPGNRPVSALSI